MSPVVRARLVLDGKIGLVELDRLRRPTTARGPQRRSSLSELVMPHATAWRGGRQRHRGSADSKTFSTSGAKKRRR